MTEVAARLGSYMPGATPQFGGLDKAPDGYVSTSVPTLDYGRVLSGSNKYLFIREPLA